MYVIRPAVLAWLLAVAIAGGAEGPAAAGVKAPLAPEPIFSSITERFARRFPDEHISEKPMDDVVSQRAWSNYLESLDEDRVYFLASDIATFRAAADQLDDELEAGTMDFAFRVFEVFKDRVSNRCAFVERILATPPDLSVQESYHWRRKDAPWPADEAEWDRLWRQRVKNDYIRGVLAQEAVAREVARATNTVPGAAIPPATNAVEAPDAVVAASNATGIAVARPAPTPAESIVKRFRQYRTMVEDSDATWVLERYLSAFAHAYDPHSDYMSAAAMDDFDIEMKLSLVGIGAVLGSEEGAAKVMRLIPGGPAQRAGELKVGDKIVAVAQGSGAPEDILHLPLREIVKKIRGKQGTRVVLTVIPASDPTGSTTRQIEIVRDEVKLEDQGARWRLETVPASGGTNGPGLALGVVTLPSFYADMRPTSLWSSEGRSCARDVEKLLREARGKGVEGILIDLRNNGGGSLAEVVTMTGLFIPGGPAVQVKEGHATRRVLSDEDDRVTFGGPVVVLVNRLSASASEILAAALQDYGRAVIVGDSKTHGKGTVQTILDLGRDPKYGAIRVTNASYYRISGDSTQLKGVTPDIVLASPFDFLDLGEEFLTYPLELTRISPASYTADTNLPALRAELKRRSEARRAADPRFEAYGKVLQRIAEMNRTEDIPLDLDSRRKLAQAETEMAELQKEMMPDEDEPGAVAGDRDKDKDLVLGEALRILADFVALDRAQPRPVPRPVVAAPRKKGLWDLFEDFLGNEEP